MKVDDLVVCLDDDFPVTPHLNEQCPRKGYYYTVRDIIKRGKSIEGIRLEEIVNPVQVYFFRGDLTHMECFFDISRFSKIYDDFDVQKFVEEIFDNKK